MRSMENKPNRDKNVFHLKKIENIFQMLHIQIQLAIRK